MELFHFHIVGGRPPAARLVFWGSTGLFGFCFSFTLSLFCRVLTSCRRVLGTDPPSCSSRHNCFRNLVPVFCYELLRVSSPRRPFRSCRPREGTMLVADVWESPPGASASPFASLQRFCRNDFGLEAGAEWPTPPGTGDPFIFFFEVVVKEAPRSSFRPFDPDQRDRQANCSTPPPLADALIGEGGISRRRANSQGSIPERGRRTLREHAVSGPRFAHTPLSLCVAS